MNERIYKKEACRMLGNIGNRTFKKWCEQNGVKIFRENGSNMEYVLKVEFELAYNYNVMPYIEQKYRCSLEEFNSRMNFEVELQTTIDERNKKRNIKSKYQPKHEHELKWLSSLTNNLIKNNNKV